MFDYSVYWREGRWLTCEIIKSEIASRAVRLTKIYASGDGGKSMGMVMLMSCRFQVPWLLFPPQAV